MGGGVMVGDPYENHRYPLSGRWVPVYDSSLPTRRSNGRGFYNGFDYDGIAPNAFFEDPSRKEVNSGGKRKFGFEREPTLTRPQVRNVFVEDGRRTSGPSPCPTQMQVPVVSSPVATPELGVSGETAGTSGNGSSSKSFVSSTPVTLVKDIEESKSVVGAEEGSEQPKNPMSLESAARLIQSWLRGYLVRRTQPLEQLRGIARVKSQLMDIDARTCDADFMEHARVDFKARIKLTESLMNLLLQLDAIQGALPVVRDIRKSLVKEVIHLQEKVDLLLSSEKPVAELLHPSMKNSSDQLPVDNFTESKSMTVDGTEDQPEHGVEQLDLESKEPMMINEIINQAAEDSERMSEPDPDEASIENITAVMEASKRLQTSVGRGHGNLHFQPMEVDTKIDMEVIEGQTSHGNWNSISSPATKELKEVDDTNCGPGDVRIATAEGLVMDRCETGGCCSVAEERKQIVNGECTDLQGDLHLRNSLEGDEWSGDATVHRKLTDEEMMEDTENALASNSAVVGQRVCDHPVEGNHITSLLRARSLSEVVDCEDALAFHPSVLEATSLHERSGCADVPASTPDSELQSVGVHERNQSAESVEFAPDGVKDGVTVVVPNLDRDNQELLVKLSEETRALKAMLVDVMESNKRQLATMKAVNNKLDKLESELLRTRCRKTRKNSRRRSSKSSRMR